MKGSEVIFAVAHLQPATSVDVAEEFGIDKKSDVSVSLLEQYRRGLLVRRKLPTEGGGKDPYEYRLAEFDVVVQDKEH